MKLYIWTRVSYVTDNYHDDGGIAVIAADLEAAKSVVSEHCRSNWPKDEDAANQAAGHLAADLETEPDVLDLAGDPEPRLWIFPDAGCC